VGLALELGATSTLPPGAADAAANLSEDAPQYVERALELCVQAGGSDVLLHPGSAPCLRIDGQLRRLAAQQPLAAASIERFLNEILSEDQRMQLALDSELRSVCELPNGLRARAHVYLSELGWNLVLHTLTREVPVPERLGLGGVLRTLRDAPRGLCICSGPSGAGRTTTLWALAHALASERALHVVSLEGPTEMIFADRIGLFEQREVGRHVASYEDGVDWAAAQAADVIIVADLLAPGTLAACLRASRAGCLVLAGMRAGSSQKALSSLNNQPPVEAGYVRTELAHALRLLLHQRLVAKASGPGRVVAVEQVVNTPQVAQLIRDDQLQQLTATLAAAKNAGTISLEDALDELVRSATITSEVRTAAVAAARGGARMHGN
jgi:twitching motility protein PilT